MNDIFWELVTKYLSNEASETDIQELSNFMDSDKKYQEVFEDIAKKWHDAGDFGNAAYDVQGARNRLLREISEKDPWKKNRETKTVNFLIGAAATLLLFFGIYHLAKDSILDDMAWKEFTTVENEKLRVLLPDSSVVWLNENTSMSYNFSSSDKRRLRLDGEAFFEVYRNESSPFTVSNPHFTTTVLGTSFNIDSENGNGASISVISGKVAVSDHKDKGRLYLERGQRAVFDETSKRLRKERSMAIDNEMAWVHRKLVFKDLPFGKALGYLSENYDVKFQVTNSELNHCLITGTFQNESLKNILTMVCSTLDCDFTEGEGNTIILSGNGCEKNRRILELSPGLKTNK